jgi:hypothetical protein
MRKPLRIVLVVLVLVSGLYGGLFAIGHDPTAHLGGRLE